MYGRWRRTKDWLHPKNKKVDVLEFEYTDLQNTNAQTQHNVQQIANEIMLDYVKEEMMRPELIFNMLNRMKEFEKDSMYWQEHVDDIESSDSYYYDDCDYE